MAQTTNTGETGYRHLITGDVVQPGDQTETVLWGDVWVPALAIRRKLLGHEPAKIYRRNERTTDSQMGSKEER